MILVIRWQSPRYWCHPCGSRQAPNRPAEHTNPRHPVSIAHTSRVFLRLPGSLTEAHSRDYIFEEIDYDFPLRGRFRPFH